MIKDNFASGLTFEELKGKLNNTYDTATIPPTPIANAEITPEAQGDLSKYTELFNKIEHWKFKDQNNCDLEVRNNNYVTNSVYGNGHTIFYKKVIQSLKGNEVDIVEGKEGLKSLKFILAAYESSKKGKIVKL